MHTYFISEKRKLSITNENKKATFEVFAINSVFRGSLGLFTSCNPKQNLIQNIFTIFRKKNNNKKTGRILPNPGVLANSGLYVIGFVSFSLA